MHITFITDYVMATATADGPSSHTFPAGSTIEVDDAIAPLYLASGHARPAEDSEIPAGASTEPSDETTEDSLDKLTKAELVGFVLELDSAAVEADLKKLKNADLIDLVQTLRAAADVDDDTSN